MTFPVEYLREFFEGLTFRLSVKEVLPVGTAQKLVLRRSSTHYANIKNFLKINGVPYRVTAVERNVSITVEGGPALLPGVHTLAAPEFLHGPYLEAQQELALRLTADDYDSQKLWPLVYLIEPLDSLKKVSDPRSAFEWDGTVRFYIVNQTDWAERPGQQYDSNLQALGAVVDAIERYYRRYFKVTEASELSHVSRTKFVTKPKGLSAAKEEQVFSQSLSAIECTMRCPIVKCKTVLNY